MRLQGDVMRENLCDSQLPNSITPGIFRRQRHGLNACVTERLREVLGERILQRHVRLEIPLRIHEVPGYSRNRLDTIGRQQDLHGDDVVALHR